MKNARKIQFILTPIYVCILSVMLVVVSFSWYKASSSTNIQTKSSDVSKTAEAPKGINVDLSPIGDDYSLNEGTYTVEKKFDSEDSTKVLLTGYFGQFGNEPFPSVDKPYIVFYEAHITTTKDVIDVNSAFIKKSEVQKVTKDDAGNVVNNGDPVIGNFTSKDDSAYTINFYTCTNTGNTYTFTDESGTFVPTGTDQTVYFGIKFYPSVVNENTTDNNCFLYSDISFFGSEYVLTSCFTNIESANS